MNAKISDMKVHFTSLHIYHFIISDTENVFLSETEKQFAFQFFLPLTLQIAEIKEVVKCLSSLLFSGQVEVKSLKLMTTGFINELCCLWSYFK